MAFRQSYSAETTITGFSTLSAAANVTCDAVDNSVTRYAEILLEIKARITSGTLEGSPAILVRILSSIDAGTEYSSVPTPYLTLPFINLVAYPSLTTQAYHARFIPPQYWKLYMKNSSNYAIAGSASFRGITFIGV